MKALYTAFSAGALTLALPWLAGCPADAPQAPPKKAERFESVAPAPVKKDAVDAFCDTHDESDTAPTFNWPKLDGPEPTSTGWTWVNAWATWCGPCVSEMPMLVRWQERLAKEGVELAIAFLSLDSKAADVLKYAAAHPSIPVGLRIADFALVGPWLQSNNLPTSASIPLQFFVDGNHRVRCTRMGAISETDFDAVKQIVTR